MGARHNFLALYDFSTLTMVSDVVTATQTLHTIAAESGVEDELKTITVGFTDLAVAGTTVRPFIVIRADAGDTITIKHETGNISLASENDFLLDSGKLFELWWDGTWWRDTQVSSISDGAPAGATIVVGAEAGDVINVAIQLLDHNGNDLAISAAVIFYLADDANGITPTTGAPDDISIGTDGGILPYVAEISGLLISEADGDIDIDITENNTPTFYLVIKLPTGKLVVSDAITFA